MRALLGVSRHVAHLHRHPLEIEYRRVAARAGVLLAYLDGDAQTVRRVRAGAGAALATYEVIAPPEYSGAVTQGHNPFDYE